MAVGFTLAVLSALEEAMTRRRAFCVAAAISAGLASRPASAQSVSIDVSTRYQTIDGFGTCLSGSEAKETWWQNLYFEDLQASIIRMDISPTFVSQYSGESYCSPWYGQPAPLDLDGTSNGPAGTRTRPYTGAADYSNAFGGCTPPIAVMGPDIDANVKLFDFSTAQAVPGLVAQMGKAKAKTLGDFKLYASMWSPAPWVKVTSGNSYSGGAYPLPTAQPWPFIWGGNYSGGKLDVSGTPVTQFDDGTGPTSALTQFARGLAAFLRGFQNAFGVQFYKISIQNELDFEEFYNSTIYPLGSDYVAALNAARAELDKYSDLKSILIIGPEDVLGGDAYGMWQYGGGSTEADKNLHFLSDIAANSTASAAIGGFAIHGYGADGTTAAGADSTVWQYWTDGWTTSPAAGIPANVKGFTAFDKPSWMTETSGEDPEWLSSSMSGGFPDQGAFSIAVKIHQALTTGRESAWLYWQMTDGSAATDSDVSTLTDSTQLANCPKYVAAKHFFRYIRPGSKRVAATVTGSSDVLASAYVLDATAALTVVLVNESSSSTTATVDLSGQPPGLASFSAFTSANGSYWQPSTVTVIGSKLSVPIPGYGVVTLSGSGTMPITDAGADSGKPTSDGGVRPPPGTDGSLPGRDGAAGEAPTPGSSGGCGCTTAPRLDTARWMILFALPLARRLQRRRVNRGS
jgi:O-glycosyl hydrolase